jgi:hypothetical protein
VFDQQWGEVGPIEGEEEERIGKVVNLFNDCGQ